MALLRLKPLFVILAAVLLFPLWAQEDDFEPEQPSKPPVTLIFTPPDLEGEIVIGIFDEVGKLRRTLRFAPGTAELKVDTNGYIVQWNGRDQSGQPCPAGRYSARGYVVGNAVEVVGEAFHFNDWMAEDHIPAQDVKLQLWPDGIGVELKTICGPIFERIGSDGALTAAIPPMSLDRPLITPLQLELSSVNWAPGRADTNWLILDLDGQHVVVQLDKDHSFLRELRVPKDEPQPMEVAASPTEDAILLKEVSEGGRQRVRMLRRSEAEEEKEGRKVTDWEVVFERSLQPCARFGIVDGKLVADAEGAPQVSSIRVTLVENALEPRQNQLRLTAKSTKSGSALVSSEGLELVEISSLGGWDRFALIGDGRVAVLYQGNGIVVEEFAIRGLDHIAAFDAGTFLFAPAE